MRLLIDGYNLLHAQGLSGPAHDPERLRKAREKLLKTLSKRLGPMDRHVTRVIFDASQKLPFAPRMLWVDGITVEFASESSSADERVIDLIDRHDAPKKLVVVSSDNQIIEAARRRDCRIIGADDFMEILEDPHRPVLMPVSTPKPASLGKSEGQLPEGVIPKETDFWLKQFADLVSDESIAERLNQEHTILKSIDVAAIEREIRDSDPFEKKTRKPPPKS
jgi:predicted RNA-binding protein with PIN domain